MNAEFPALPFPNLQPPRPLPPFPWSSMAMGPKAPWLSPSHGECKFIFCTFISPASRPGPWGCQSGWPHHLPPLLLPFSPLLPPFSPFPPFGFPRHPPCGGGGFIGDEFIGYTYPLGGATDLMQHRGTAEIPWLVAWNFHYKMAQGEGWFGLVKKCVP